MVFGIKTPKSKRFYQPKFDGFSYRGYVLRSFIKDFSRYSVKRFALLFKSFLYIFTLLDKTSQHAKDLLVRKLIWSRGKLGRPLANFVILGFAFLVFMFGEVFNRTSFVSGGEVSPDYLENVNDIIPNMNIATTTLPEERKRTEAFVYTVVVGDTLSGIGAKFKISTDALKYVNSLSDNSILKVGQTVTIPPVSGLTHKIASGDSLESIASKYQVPSQAIADFNYILDTSKLVVGTELVIPGAKVPEPVIPIIPTAPVLLPQYGAATPSSSYCVWPSTVRVITQYYSWYHNGVDIATPFGRSMPPLFACTSGVVTRAGWDPFGLGLHVRIDHGNGYETVYGHMSRVDVGYGERVGRGSVLGVMGSTGRSTGPHVHFMVKFNGIAQNPLDYTQ